MENVITVALFKKHVVVGEKEWDTHFITLPNSKRCISANLTNKFKESIIRENVDFPISITLDADKDDYFLKEEEYENSDGVTLTKDVVVIQNYRSMEHLEIAKRTLNELDVLEEGE